MSILRSREVPLAILLITAMISTFDYFISWDPLQAAGSSLYSWTVTMVAVASGVGVISLVRRHYKRVATGHEERIFSIQFFVVLAATFAIGLGLSVSSDALQFLYLNTFSPMVSTLYGLIAFFIVAAAFRAFAARNIEAAILILSGIFVMLTNAPIGEAIWPGFPVIGKWLMSIINTSSYRGIIMGIAIGGIGLSIRTLLGRERAFLGRLAEE
jgi:hypothetical protein